LAKKQIFCKIWIEGWLAAVYKCVVLWAGFPLSLCGGRKNEINSPQTAPPYLQNTNPAIRILLFYQFLYIVSMCHVGSPRLHTTTYMINQIIISINILQICSP